ncbi:unnamed protein product [Callosobruchus maculatus]|uniref:Uncharacterized protein n=1 Tax=Callosobruchus maculatus TaxID=64391 RepID=A0A653C8T9_CALMS|nr:unnamed protein product [Callosobruchus maculatus]
MKILFYVVLILAAVAAYVQVAEACIGNGRSCKSNGSMGNCCSGFCYQQRGWKKGYCKRR